MFYKTVLLISLIISGSLARSALAVETLRLIPLPYDYDIDRKCQRGLIEGKVCAQFTYYDANSFGQEQQRVLRGIEKTLRPGELADRTSYGLLGQIGSAKVFIGMASPDNIATFMVFTVVNNKLIDHQIIGVDDLEENLLKRDFSIDKNYKIIVYSRRSSDIKSTRKIVGRYQVMPNGNIVALN